MIIDCHQHFWMYQPERDAWITDDMSILKRNFLPSDLRKELEKNKVQGCIAVQADQSVKETEFLLQLAKENKFIKGVVGWVDLSSSEVDKQLLAYAANPQLVGIRHILQAEKKGFMSNPAFRKGIKKLKQYNLTYDVLIYPHQIEEAIQLVKSFPDQPFVIDHLAKPYIKSGKIEEWKSQMSHISRYENVYCKLSGMVTEADWETWKKQDLIPYIDTVFEIFGVDRLMYGSDWPVCLLASSYADQLMVWREYISALSIVEREKIMGGNATKFYQLKI